MYKQKNKEMVIILRYRDWDIMGIYKNCGYIISNVGKLKERWAKCQGTSWNGGDHIGSGEDRTRWEDQVIDYVYTTGIVKWKNKIKNKEWRKIITEERRK